MNNKYEGLRLSLNQINKKSRNHSYSFLNGLRLPSYSNIKSITPRIYNSIYKLTFKSKKNLFYDYKKISSRYYSPVKTDKSILFNISQKNHSKSSYRILNINNNLLNRLKITSIYSERTLHKKNIKKILKKLYDKKKKLNKNKTNFNSLKKKSVNEVNEVNFIPSPFLLDESKLLTENNINLINEKEKNKLKKSKEKIKHENRKNNDENKKNKKIKDKNLPIFLREKYNIKGTNIISPFCQKARDEFLYKRIFYNYLKKPVDTKKIGVNNKLNILYAENEEKFRKKIQIINKRIREEGKKEKNAQCPNSVEEKLTNIKHKIKFMKKIVDYAYPETVLTRVRESIKAKENSRNRLKNFLPYISSCGNLEKYSQTEAKTLTNLLTISKV
jgi:hypothetical protein